MNVFTQESDVSNATNVLTHSSVEAASNITKFDVMVRQDVNVTFVASLLGVSPASIRICGRIPEKNPTHVTSVEKLSRKAVHCAHIVLRTRGLGHTCVNSVGRHLSGYPIFLLIKKAIPESGLTNVMRARKRLPTCTASKFTRWYILEKNHSNVQYVEKDSASRVT